MSDEIVIESSQGPYSVNFVSNAFEELVNKPLLKKHFIIDSNIAIIYQEQLKLILQSGSVLIINATESAKTLDSFTSYVESLVDQSIRRDHCLVAIGGGIIQDISSFLATTLLRGVQWEFYPTTLLSQADSCIGSKSSINVGSVKNILGTFCPPRKITIDTELLNTLTNIDIRSGIGEMLKVHAIAGTDFYNQIATSYENLLTDNTVLKKFLIQSLKIKKNIIEVDEFDKGIRNVMNYGHSFGHALETATNFLIPHGIAVTIGMDLANYVAVQLGYVSSVHFDRMHSILMENSTGFHSTKIPLDLFIGALTKDKKNFGNQLSLILPNSDGTPQRVSVNNSPEFYGYCTDYFSSVLKNGKS